MKKRKSRVSIKKIALIMMAEAAMLLLSSCGEAKVPDEVTQISEKYAIPDEKQLIVYTSHKQEVYLPIIREFENRTGICVDLHTGGTAEMFNQARDLSGEGKIDIVFGGGVESYEAQKDLFMPYEAKEKDLLDPNYTDSENYWTPFTELPIVFVYNKKLVSYSRVSKSWEDLFDDRWKGQIAFADIEKSGTSYTILATMEQIFNEDASVLVPRFYDCLDGKILSSSGDVVPGVESGKFLVGITLEETAKKAIASGSDIAMIYPNEGTSAVPDGIAIVKNAPHTYNAGLFIDFVIGYDTQEYAVDNFARRSVRTDFPGEETAGFTQIEFDIARSADEEGDIFAIWKALNEQEGE